MSRLKMLQMGKGVYQEYVNTVKGNENTPYDVAHKKLSRNVILGRKISTNGETTLYHYGNLDITVVGNTITGIKNNKGNIGRKFKKNIPRYIKLNKQLGIAFEHEQPQLLSV